MLGVSFLAARRAALTITLGSRDGYLDKSIQDMGRIHNIHEIKHCYNHHRFSTRTKQKERSYVASHLLGWFDGLGVRSVTVLVLSLFVMGLRIHAAARGAALYQRFWVIT